MTDQPEESRVTLEESIRVTADAAERARPFEMELNQEWRWISPVPGFVAATLLTASEQGCGETQQAASLSVEFFRRSHSPRTQISVLDERTSFGLRRVDADMTSQGKPVARSTTAFIRDRGVAEDPSVDHQLIPRVERPEDVPTIEESLGRPFERQGVIRHFEERPLDWIDVGTGDPNRARRGSPGRAAFRSWYTLTDGSSPGPAVVRAAALVIADFAPLLAAKRAQPSLMDRGLAIVPSTWSIDCHFYPYDTADLTILCVADSPWTHGRTLIGRATCFTSSLQPILTAQTHAALSIR